MQAKPLSQIDVTELEDYIELTPLAPMQRMLLTTEKFPERYFK